jgi:GntR family transcriptional regulator/MocR family aminotransferase
MLRPWELSLEIDRQSGTAIHKQIAQKIIFDIQSGRFTPGIALPGTRELAYKIHVNRKTVIQAYDELVSQGWLVSENKRGTFVSQRILSINYSNQPPELNLQHKVDSPLTAVPPLHSKRSTNDFIHFSDGLPDARLLPIELMARAMRHALNNTARNNKASYGDPRGALILREAILQMLNIERALHAKIDNVCMVRGSQMGVYLIAKTCLKPNQNIVIEQLACPLVREALMSSGANIISVSHDQEGINTDHLAALCAQQKIHAVYVTPNHQMPTAVVMSQNRRDQLLALADRYDFLIIEDDSGYEFNFSKENYFPLASLAKSKRVIYIGSLSKVLAPGFRLGFIVASTEVIEACAKKICIIDRQGDLTTELAIAELLHLGEIKKHLLRTVKIYETRQNLLRDLLQKEFGHLVAFNRATNGLAIWLETHPSINIHTLIKEAELEKVRFNAGAEYSSGLQPVAAIRLGFANLNEDEIQTGIYRLKKAMLNQQPRLLRA